MKYRSIWIVVHSRMISQFLLMILSKLKSRYNHQSIDTNASIYDQVAKEIINIFEEYLRNNYYILTIKDAFLIYNTIRGKLRRY